MAQLPRPPPPPLPGMLAAREKLPRRRLLRPNAVLPRRWESGHDSSPAELETCS